MKLNRTQKDLISTLFNAPGNPGSAQKLIDNFYESALLGDLLAKQVLGDYTLLGHNTWLRSYALDLLVNAVCFGDIVLLPYFQHHINAAGQYPCLKAIQYVSNACFEPSDSLFPGFFTIYSQLYIYLAACSIEGYLKILGAEGYPLVVKLICDPEMNIEIRGNAIFFLSAHSQHPFDKGLDKTPLQWRSIWGKDVADVYKYFKKTCWDEQLFRIQEIQQWADNGFPPPENSAPLI